MSKDELVTIIKSGFKNSVGELFLGEFGYYYLEAVNICFSLDKKEAKRKKFAAIF